MSRKENVLFKYSEKSMEDAIEAIKNGKISVRQACRLYSVPKSTVLDKIEGRTPEKRKMGRCRYIGLQGELQLVHWITNQCKRGTPPKRCDVLNSAQQIVKLNKMKTPFLNGRPGTTWFNSFMKRNPTLSIRIPERLSKSQSNIKEEDIRRWFKNLEDELKELECFDILEDPSRIFNMDETCIELSPSTGKVVGIRGWKNIYEVSPGSGKSNFTFLGTFSAAGDIITPNIIFPYVRVPYDIAKTVLFTQRLLAQL